jgi:hypothetical protein
MWPSGSLEVMKAASELLLLMLKAASRSHLVSVHCSVGRSLVPEAEMTSVAYVLNILIHPFCSGPINPSKTTDWKGIVGEFLQMCAPPRAVTTHISTEDPQDQH